MTKDAIRDRINSCSLIGWYLVFADESSVPRNI